MTLWRHPGTLATRSEKSSQTNVNLVVDDLPNKVSPPEFIGIEWPPEPLAWSIPRVSQILSRFEASPEDDRFQREARKARYCISRFWLLAPVDQLEQLYTGPIGRVQRRLLHGKLPGLPLAKDEGAWQSDLRKLLMRAEPGPEYCSLLLALMPYCTPGQLKVDKPAENLPSWLQNDYLRSFESTLFSQTAAPLASHQHTTLPMIGHLSGPDAFALLQDTRVSERLQVLIHRFRLDVDNAELTIELAALRRLLAQIWLDGLPERAEDLYRNTRIGVMYRALLACNFGAEPLADADLADRLALQSVVADQRSATMLQATLALLLYLPQGASVPGLAVDQVPGWFQREYPTLAGLPLPPEG